jgi:endonuclease-3
MSEKNLKIFPGKAPLNKGKQVNNSTVSLTHRGESAKLNRVIKKLEQHIEVNFDHKEDPAPVLDVLIATKLSQNTTDKTSYRAFLNLKKDFRSWEDVSKAPLDKIKSAIKICGLANTKSRDIKKMLGEMKNKYGKLDLSFFKDLSNEEIYKELLQYTGIGVKTISCVLLFSLGRDAFPVDTHVHRVLNRLGLVKTKNARETFENIKDKISAGKKYIFHTMLILFGRNICKANNPRCNICFLYSDCCYERKAYFREIDNGKEMKENNFIIMEHLNN